MFSTCISCLYLFSKIVNKIVRVLAYIFFFKLKIHLSYLIYYFERQRLTLGLYSHTKKTKKKTFQQGNFMFIMIYQLTAGMLFAP